MTERWAPVSRWEGLYEVSDGGRVRSATREYVDKLNRPRFFAGRVLANQTRRDGYVTVRLVDRSRGETVCVHRLVAWAFLGAPGFERAEVNHKSGDKSDNRPSNLEWTTPAENRSHAHRVGLSSTPGSRPGVTNGFARLTDESVKEIRALRARGATYRSLASRFGVDVTTVSLVARRITWRHVA